MKIVYLTAGAAGMYCGSCMHDNTLARAISRQGVDIELVPTYTPIRTDESDFSVDQVFFGGINVYLQQKLPFLRFLPRLFDRFLDSPSLIRRVTRNASSVSPTELGKLAASMLLGEKGNQRKEVKRLCRWLKEKSRPDVMIFSNILIGGCLPALKRELQVKTLVTLQGDDIFLESLPEKYKQKCIESIAALVPFVDQFLSHSHFYADAMSDYLSIPREKIVVTPLGIDTQDFEDATGANVQRPTAPTIGYLARLAPEKGLDVLVDAFIKLKQAGRVPDAKLKIAGWLGNHQQEFVDQQFEKLRQAGFEQDVENVGAIDRDEKCRFLQSIDLLSVPTVYKDPKGLFVLEAMAAGIPVVQPDHGAFPEVLKDSGGGLLFRAEDPDHLASTITELLLDREQCRALGAAGHKYVHQFRNADSMAKDLLDVIEAIPH